MMYPLLQLEDGTEIVHSEMRDDKTVKVYIEKPDEKLCFRTATCWLPQYRWEEVNGFSDDEMARIREVVRSTAHLMMEFADTGGFDNAASF